MSGITKFEKLLEELKIQVNRDLFELARVHRSWAYENGQITPNERLEFLGDSVLGLIVTEYIYQAFPDYPEGRLARLRSAVVNTRALADVARELELGQLVRLGRGEKSTGGHDKSSILADITEAMIGAIYLSAGKDGASKFIHHVLDSMIERASKLDAGLDWKTSLQEVCALNEWEMPVYEVEQSGPDHNRSFTAYCVINQQRFGPGEAHNKKQAEQLSAGMAYASLKSQNLVGEGGKRSA